MIITEKDLQMLHTMPPPPPGDPLLPGRENDLKLGELRGVLLAEPPLACLSLGKKNHFHVKL